MPKWPQIQLFSEGGQIRSRYIEAMKAADNEDYRELIAFMKDFVEEKKFALFGLSTILPAGVTSKCRPPLSNNLKGFA